MANSESQLQSWAKQGAVTLAKQTHESIRHALNTSDWSQGVTYDIYLQGSYKNDTNIRGDSDVDVVVELTSALCSNLTDYEKRSLGLTPATYGWSEFVRDVLNGLTAYYGAKQIRRGNKCMNLAPTTGRLPADIIICAQYKYYSNLIVVAEGITFWTHGNSQQLVSYPKIHTDKCVTKNGETNGWFKPSVRMFKNARSYLVDLGVIDEKVAPSYLLECLIYGVPNHNFGSDFQNTYCNILNWLLTADYGSFTFPSLRQSLFGTSDDQWSVDKAKRLLNQLVKLWNNS
jgi:hypothetical protein